MLGRNKPAGTSSTSASPFACALGVRGDTQILAAAKQEDQPALTASRHTTPARGSVSIGFKVQKTKEDLRKAAKSKDLHEMKAALAAASALAAIAEVDITTEEALVREAILAQGTHAIERMNIHDSSAIFDEMVHKFWALMQRESIKADPNTPPDTVTRAGYEAVYICINKCVWKQTEDGEMWDIAAAKAEGQIDWELDINRFKENATINNWLRRIRELFRRNAETLVETSGWGLLFRLYDADGSGVLDFEEFIGASRTDLNISTDDVSDADIKRIFDSADLDGGGEISSEEFVEWLSKNISNTPDSFFEDLVARFITTAKAKVLGLGWKAMWAKYDADQSDELDKEEFTECIRTECRFSNDDISDDELAELFRAIDADGSGALSSQEFSAAVRDDSDDLSLNFYCFKKSIFELADLYVDTVSESMYVAFLDAVHEEIAEEIAGGATEEIRDVKGLLMPEVNSWSFRLKQPDEITSLFTRRKVARRSPGIAKFRQSVETAMTQKAVWLDHLACYTRYKAELRREPEPHEKLAGMSLGQWCNDQRSSYRANALHHERIAKLEKASFPWAVAVKAPMQGNSEDETNRRRKPPPVPAKRELSAGSVQQQEGAFEDERQAKAPAERRDIAMSKGLFRDTPSSDVGQGKPLLPQSAPRRRHEQRRGRSTSMDGPAITDSDLSQWVSSNSHTQLGGRREFAVTPKKVALARPKTPGSDAAGTAPRRKPNASLSPLIAREVALIEPLDVWTRPSTIGEYSVSLPKTGSDISFAMREEAAIQRHEAHVTQQWLRSKQEMHWEPDNALDMPFHDRNLGFAVGGNQQVTSWAKRCGDGLSPEPSWAKRCSGGLSPDRARGRTSEPRLRAHHRWLSRPRSTGSSSMAVVFHDSESGRAVSASLGHYSQGVGRLSTSDPFLLRPVSSQRLGHNKV
jgi:Ca2+-binding EF-hand superfamily protein